MDEIKAKNILDDKFWLLENIDGSRIGTIQSGSDVVKVNLNGEILSFEDLEQAQQELNIKFVAQSEKPDQPESKEYFLDEFPTKTFPYNHMYDTQSKLHIFTKDEKSNSYHCAGYFILKFKTGWTQSFCPRVSTLMKNDWDGPYKTELEMNLRLRQRNEQNKNK